MSKFSEKFPRIAATLADAFGQGNAFIEYDNENNAASLGSEHLGAINKSMEEKDTALENAKTAAAEVAEKHTKDIEAKDARIVELEKELATVKGETPAGGATDPGAKNDPKEEPVSSSWVDLNAEHNQRALELIGKK